LSFSTSAGYATKSGFYESPLIPYPKASAVFIFPPRAWQSSSLEDRYFFLGIVGMTGIDDAKTFDTQNPMQWIKQRLSDHPATPSYRFRWDEKPE
jgi:hypothetical protein